MSGTAIPEVPPVFAPPVPVGADDEPDEGGEGTPRVRRDGESRYSRQSARLPRIGEGAGSVLASMAGLRKSNRNNEEEEETT